MNITVIINISPAIGGVDSFDTDFYTYVFYIRRRTVKLVESGGGRLAYVVEDGMAVKRAVEVGGLSVSQAQIVSGLEEGDRIIISDTGRFEGAEAVLLRR